MNTSSRFPAAAASTDLGVSGYTFADLHDPERLASFTSAFARKWRRRTPTSGPSGTHTAGRPTRRGRRSALSNLLIGMAPYVSRFLTRLFQVTPRSMRSVATTTAQDDSSVSRSISCRRRALPLLKGGAHVVSTPEDDAVVARLTRRADVGDDDLELAIARAGCALMDREKAGDTSEGSNLKSKA